MFSRGSALHSSSRLGRRVENVFLNWIRMCNTKTFNELGGDDWRLGSCATTWSLPGLDLGFSILSCAYLASQVAVRAAWCEIVMNANNCLHGFRSSDLLITSCVCSHQTNAALGYSISAEPICSQTVGGAIHTDGDVTSFKNGPRKLKRDTRARALWCAQTYFYHRRTSTKSRRLIRIRNAMNSFVRTRVVVPVLQHIENCEALIVFVACPLL